MGTETSKLKEDLLEIFNSYSYTKEETIKEISRSNAVIALAAIEANELKIRELDIRERELALKEEANDRRVGNKSGKNSANIVRAVKS